MNPQTPTQWLPGILVLGGGLLFALLYLLTTRQKRSEAAPRPKGREPGNEGVVSSEGVLDDLTRRYQGLIEQLRELNADKHHLTPEQFQTEKARLEREAADALRAREEHARGAVSHASTVPPTGKPQGAPSGFFGRHPQLAGALWGAGVALFGIVLWTMLQQNERPRGDNDTATGRIPPGTSNPPGPQTSEDAELKTMVEQVNQHPENVEAAAMVAHELLRRQRFDQANAITERALGVDPFFVENRIHHALLTAVRGDMPGALAQLKHLADTYPDAHEALLFQGSLAGNSGNLRLALECFERFAAEAPADEQPPQLAEGILNLRRQLGVNAGN